MQFNPDPNKQANEVIFSWNTSSNASILGITLDSNLNFNRYVHQKIKKCNWIIGLIRQFSINLPRNALLGIYEPFVRPPLDYGYLLHDKPNNESFQNKL